MMITPWKINVAPEKLPSQKESSVPTIIFQGQLEISFLPDDDTDATSTSKALCAQLCQKPCLPGKRCRSGKFAICLVDGRLAEFYSSDMRYMDVSENSGTPKSSILIGFSIINHPFWGTPISGNTHIEISSLQTILGYHTGSFGFFTGAFYGLLCSSHKLPMPIFHE